MGDFEVSLPRQNGELGEQSMPSAWPLEPSNPLPQEIPSESWRLSEQMTRMIIWKIQPTRVSEERRRSVVDHVQQLIGRLLCRKVFPFGSVPLKTYLPDGDIDLTALGFPNDEDSLAAAVRSVLEREEQNKASEFEVKDVQYIHAEVKLVKCLVQNIVVDISFNQIGGLCTLCFLDEVDRLIGKNHLFKRTIILVKAWCYYESRILGAHHGLISTYALETLVLYIFHLFHSSLNGPLAVLYRFLDYFSKFDWDNFCISLRGPVHLSSLPEIVAEVPETDGGDLLLSTDFLSKCGERYSVTPRISESSHRLFVKKYLNIVDPLKENNNLGRSVSKGNLYRIRSAFAYGARKLGRILLLPRENMSNELSKFFKNTLERHGNGERPDVQDSYNKHLDDNEVAKVSPNLNMEKGTGHNVSISSSPHGNFHGGHDNLNGTKISLKENGKGMEDRIPPSNLLLDRNHLQGHFTADAFLKYDNAVSGSYLTGDVTSRTSGSSIANEVRRLSSTSSEANTPSNRAHHAPHLFFCQENWDTVKEDADQYVSCPDSPSRCSEYELSSIRSQHCSESRQTDSITLNRGQAISNGNVESSSVCSSIGDEGIPDSGSSETDLVVGDRIPNAYDLADLSGNPQMHYDNFQHAQRFHDSYLNMPVSPGNLTSPGYAIHSPVFPHINGFIPSSPYPHASSYYQMNPGFIPRPYGFEDMPKPRGTGTYIPNANHHAYKERSAPGRGRHHFPASQVQRSRNNGRAVTPPESYLIDARGNPVSSGNGRGKPGQSEFSQPSNNTPRRFSHSNGNFHPLESQLQSVSLDPAPLGSPTPESGRTPESNSPHNHSSGSMVSSSIVQKPGMSLNHERSIQVYRLKDEDEFPPLSGRGNQNASVHSNEHQPAWEAKR